MVMMIMRNFYVW